MLQPSFGSFRVTFSKCALMRYYHLKVILCWLEIFPTTFQARLYFSEYSIGIMCPLWLVCFNVKWPIVFVPHQAASSMVLFLSWYKRFIPRLNFSMSSPVRFLRPQKCRVL